MLQFCILIAICLEGSGTSLLRKSRLKLLSKQPVIPSLPLPALASTADSKVQLPLVQRLVNEHHGVVYTGEMLIGDVPQKVIYDTGSWELVVMSQCRSASVLQMNDGFRQPTSTPPPGWNSEACKEYRRTARHVARHTHTKLSSSSVTCCASEYCPHATYDPTHSNTFEANANTSLQLILYGSGAVIVRPGTDMIAIRSSFSEQKNSNMAPLQVIVNHSVPILNKVGAPTAIVGMGPGNVSHANDRWMSRLGIQRYMFCFPNDPDADGFITWHDVDRTPDPRWKTVPVDGALHWAFKTDSFKMFRSAPNHEEFEIGCEDGCGVLVDTGSSFFTVPAELLQRVVDVITNIGVHDCSDLAQFPSLSFQLGGHDFLLPPESYLADAGQQNSSNFGLSNGRTRIFTLPLMREDATLAQAASSEGRSVMVGTCVLLLQSLACPMPTPWGPLIIMGMPLFRTYAAQFDLSQEPARYIHFSEADPTCCTQTQGSCFAWKGSVLPKIDMHELQLPHESIARAEGPSMQRL